MVIQETLHTTDPAGRPMVICVEEPSMFLSSKQALEDALALEEQAKHAHPEIANVLKRNVERTFNTAYHLSLAKM